MCTAKSLPPNDGDLLTRTDKRIWIRSVAGRGLRGLIASTKFDARAAYEDLIVFVCVVPLWHRVHIEPHKGTKR
jgi:hypothetical protein